MIKHIVWALLLTSQISRSQALPAAAGFPPLAHQDTLGLPATDSLPLTVLLQAAPQPLLPAFSAAKRSFPGPSLLPPAFLLGYGLLTLDNPEFLESNEAVQREITAHYAGFHTALDNYTRYVPLAAAYGLNLTGVPGRHDLVRLSLLFGLSSLLNNTLTNQLKALTRERRPDYPSFDAFPSRHTSTGFANAELFHQEYKHLSAWYGIGGYAFAVATGSMRLLNNRHWLSDVVAGAGIGMLSTRLAYVIYPWLEQNIRLRAFPASRIMVVPSCQQGAYGLGLSIAPGGPDRNNHGSAHLIK